MDLFQFLERFHQKNLAIVLKICFTGRQIYQLGNVDDRIPILQLDPDARTKTKARCEERKMVLNQELGGRLTTLKIVEMF